MTAPHSPTRSDDTRYKLNLNPLHIAAAALAAVTAAVIGSLLGAAGTLIGAAGASVVTSIGTALYQVSLERSREKVRALTRRNRASQYAGESPAPPTDLPRSAQPLPGLPFTDGADHEWRSRTRSRSFSVRWVVVLAGAVGAFLVAMALITGFEWVSGKTVGGNGNGTTIGHVLKDQPGPRQPPTAPAPSGPESSTPTITTTPDSATPTTTPDGRSIERTPTKTSSTPAPSETTSAPPLIPPILPSIGR